jgi:hypothetical protein
MSRHVTSLGRGVPSSQCVGHGENMSESVKSKEIRIAIPACACINHQAIRCLALPHLLAFVHFRDDIHFSVCARRSSEIVFPVQNNGQGAHVVARSFPQVLLKYEVIYANASSHPPTRIDFASPLQAPSARLLLVPHLFAYITASAGGRQRGKNFFVSFHPRQEPRSHSCKNYPTRPRLVECGLGVH